MKNFGAVKLRPSADGKSEGTQPLACLLPSYISTQNSEGDKQ